MSVNTSNNNNSTGISANIPISIADNEISAQMSSNKSFFSKEDKNLIFVIGGGVLLGIITGLVLGILFGPLAGILGFCAGTLVGAPLTAIFICTCIKNEDKNQTKLLKDKSQSNSESELNIDSNHEKRMERLRVISKRLDQFSNKRNK